MRWHERSSSIPKFEGVPWFSSQGRTPAGCPRRIRLQGHQDQLRTSMGPCRGQCMDLIFSRHRFCGSNPYLLKSDRLGVLISYFLMICPTIWLEFLLFYCFIKKVYNNQSKCSPIYHLNINRRSHGLLQNHNRKAYFVLLLLSSKNWSFPMFLLDISRCSGFGAATPNLSLAYRKNRQYVPEYRIYRSSLWRIIFIIVFIVSGFL